MQKQRINTNYSGEYNYYVRDKSDKFTITEDKLRLKLINLKKSLENKNSVFCYLSMIVTISIALISSNFKNFIFSKDIWQALFIIGLFFMVGFFIKDLILYIKNKKDIGDVIKDIKEEQK